MAGLLEDELRQVVMSLSIFSLPALVYAAPDAVPIPVWFRWLLPVLVLLGPTVYWLLTRSGGHKPRTENANASEEYEPMDITPEPNTTAVELIATNYEQLSEQAKYRDELLIKTNYFSLAIIAVLVNIFLRIGVETRPLIAMVGAVTAYAFWLATESYKGTRDAINKQLRTLEDEQYTELNVVSTYDTRDRTTVGKRSLSSYLIGLQIVASLFWASVYFGYVLYLIPSLAQ